MLPLYILIHSGNNHLCTKYRHLFYFSFNHPLIFTQFSKIIQLKLVILYKILKLNFIFFFLNHSVYSFFHFLKCKNTEIHIFWHFGLFQVEKPFTKQQLPKLLKIETYIIEILVSSFVFTNCLWIQSIFFSELKPYVL